MLPVALVVPAAVVLSVSVLRISVCCDADCEVYLLLLLL
jgi:hypothetical protein